MSSFPILGDRPIDQWKVTELKEELKRRKLITRGLKDDLIRRLDEALRMERENAEEEIKDDCNGGPQHQNEIININTVPPVDETAKNIGNNDKFVNLDDGKSGMDDERMNVDVDDSGRRLDANLIAGEMLDGSYSAREEAKLVDVTTIVETTVTVTENLNLGLEMQLSQKDVLNVSELENENPESQLENEDPKPQLENEDKPQLEGISVPQLVNEASKPQLVDQNPVPPHEVLLQDSSNPTNQVSEVSPDLGFQVKTDSISTDSVSITEKKNELKDNIIADNLKLELDVIKLDMVEPSSSNVAPDGGQSHPMDVEESLEKKVSAEEKNGSALNLEISKKTDNEDVGYPEKLNLDRSSGEESMEEDVIESRQIDSKNNSEQIEVTFMKEEVTVDIVGDDAASENKDHVDNKKVAAPIEKRKLQDTLKDEVAVENNEPSKRQRRWNSEGLKLSDAQSPSVLLSSTPKDASRAPVFKRSFSRSDSAISEEAPKERVVPASTNPPTNSLRIDRFLRPFTLKAVQELLGKTGSVVSFWMDHIKTHCYITYSSVEEAIETRNAVYNLQWPANGGRLLVAEFVDPQEVKMRVEAPAQVPTTPVSAAPSAPQVVTPKQTQPSPLQSNRQQQQQLPVHSLPPPPPLSNPPPARERLAVPPLAPPVEKIDHPIVTLDDLFRKTKAIPRIYYLPLSDEQVAAKLAAGGKSVN